MLLNCENTPNNQHKKSNCAKIEVMVTLILKYTSDGAVEQRVRTKIRFMFTCESIHWVANLLVIESIRFFSCVNVFI